jgi:hypothetical protein
MTYEGKEIIYINVVFRKLVTWMCSHVLIILIISMYILWNEGSDNIHKLHKPYLHISELSSLMKG